MEDLPSQNQRDVFRPLLTDFINMDHDLVGLAYKIDWNVFEEQFARLYFDTGQPAEPIRQIVGCLILKRLYDLGDETLATALMSYLYMQYFVCRLISNTSSHAIRSIWFIFESVLVPESWKPSLFIRFRFTARPPNARWLV